MTGRSFARLLAPLALVASAVALFLVVTSGGSEGGTDGSSGTARPTATATPTAERRERRQRRTYTVRPGDTPSGIADRLDVDLDALLEANPDVDPNALSPGQRLRLPSP